MGTQAKQTDIILSESEFEKLKREVELLRQVIANLTAEHDDLKNHICREIQAEYDEKVGGLELDAQRLKLEIAQLKRTIEYMQAVINQQKQADYEEAKKKTEEEYRQYEEDLHKRAEDIHNTEEYARRRAEKDKENQKKAEESKKQQSSGKTSGYETESSAPESDQEQKTKEEQDFAGTREDGEETKKHIDPDQEMKQLYRKIVKKLHPDTNPNVTEKEKDLLNEAMKAYAEGDLERIREIWEMICDGSEEEFSDTEEDLKRLRKLVERLRDQRQILLYEIERIKSTFPYTAREFLADEVAVAMRRKELLQFIEECKEEISRLEERLRELRTAA